MTIRYARGFPGNSLKSVFRKNLSTSYFRRFTPATHASMKYLSISLLLLSTTNCERSGDVPNGEPTVEPFVIPAVDISELPAAENLRLTAAIEKARANPSSAALLGKLGQGLFTNQYTTAAQQCFEQAHRIDPETFRWPYFAAIANEKELDVDSAIANYTRAIDVDPTYAPTYLRLADILLESDFNRAYELYQKAMERLPDHPRVHFGIGQCAVRKGELGRAIQEFQAAIAVAPNYAAAHYQLALALRDTGKKNEASQHLSLYQAGGMTPATNDPVRSELVRESVSGNQKIATALALTKAGRYQEAIEILESIEASPGDLFVLAYSLGATYMKAGRNEEAVIKLQEALKAEPNSAVARSNLGRAYAKTGRINEAESLLREGVANEPGDAEMAQGLGAVLTKQGRFAEAVPFVRSAVELQPGNAKYRVHLADLLIRTGNASEAQIHLEKCLAIESQNPFAIRLLQVIRSQNPPQ